MSKKHMYTNLPYMRKRSDENCRLFSPKHRANIWDERVGLLLKLQALRNWILLLLLGDIQRH